MREASRSRLHPDGHTTAVLVSRNTRELLRASLRNLQVISTSRPMEVIVVDNASGDGSAAMVRAEFPWATSIENTQNVGFGQACNQALARSEGTWVLILNPDVALDAGNLERLFEVIVSHTRAGIVGPRLLNSDGSDQEGVAGRFLSLGSVFRYACGLDRLTRRQSGATLYHVTATEPIPVDWVSGACMLLRRQLLSEVGGFDPRFFLYFEDMDLCYRAAGKGWKTYYQPGATPLHWRGASIEQEKREAAWHQAASLKLYCWKHRVQAQSLVRFLLAAAFLVRIPVSWWRLARRSNDTSRRQVRLVLRTFAAFLGRHS